MSSKKGIHVGDLLDSYTKGTLGKASFEKVKTHLIFCNVCRDQLNKLQKNLFANPVSSLKNQPSHHLKEKILPESPEPLSRGMDWRFPMKSAAVVVSIVLLYSVFRNKPESNIVSREPVPVAIETFSVATPTPSPLALPAEIQKSIPLEVPKTLPVKFQSEPFEESSGVMSGFDKPTEQLISNHADWEALWNQHVKNRTDGQPLPMIDFDQKDVAAIFAGSKPSAGYSVKIVSIEPTTWNGAPARVVTYIIGAPDPDLMTAAVLTSPFALKVLPKFNGPTFFKINP